MLYEFQRIFIYLYVLKKLIKKKMGLYIYLMCLNILWKLNVYLFIIKLIIYMLYIVLCGIEDDICLLDLVGNGYFQYFVLIFDVYISK